MRGKKIAISGKGGVGKSTVAALWALELARNDATVVAIDADPDANLAHALGIPAQERRSIIPLAENDELIHERTGATAGKTGQMFALNPRVDDLVSRFGFLYRGVQTIILGAVRKGGGGCACPESTLLKSLVRHLVLHDNETVICDMEAGVEHIGRGTAGGVDALVIVTEAGSRSIETAMRIRSLAADIGLEKKLVLLLNKVRGDSEEQVRLLSRSLPDVPVIGTIPFDERMIDCDRDGSTLFDREDAAPLLDHFETARRNCFTLIENGFTTGF